MWARGKYWPAAKHAPMLPVPASMSYEMKTHGQIGPKLQNLAREEIHRIIAALRTLSASTLNVLTHDLRKRLKRLRALPFTNERARPGSWPGNLLLSLAKLVHGPEGRRKLAGGASHRNQQPMNNHPGSGGGTPMFPAPLPGRVRSFRYSGGLRHRLISDRPPGDKKDQPVSRDSISLKAAMERKELTQRRKGAKRWALECTHLKGEARGSDKCFFFAPLRLCVTSHCRF